MANRTHVTVPLTPQERFRTLAAQWKEKSRHISNTAPMAMLWPYQQIIGMGESALPFIFEELGREPVPNGKWSSKLGKGEDIEHDTPDDVAGGLYGELAGIMKKPAVR